jgi:hypothetical protein
VEIVDPLHPVEADQFLLEIGRAEWLRLTSGDPTSFSSFRIASDRVEVVTKQDAAARPKCRSRARASK